MRKRLCEVIRRPCIASAFVLLLSWQPSTSNCQTVDVFNPAPDSTVNVLASQIDGKILVGGYFSTIAGQPRRLLARLNADGTLDPTLNSGTNLVGNSISALAICADGSVVVGGTFTTSDGRGCLARFNSDGSWDSSFKASVDGMESTVATLAVQTDGKILVGGIFPSVEGLGGSNLARLNPDGTVDGSFHPSCSAGVISLALQPDGAVLIGGFFTSVAGVPRNFIARLNSQGWLDLSFDPNADSTVCSLIVQPDGRILIAGFFQSVQGFRLADRGRIARLNPDGTLDRTFNPGANASVYSLALQTDGGILVAGDFTRLGGVSRTYLGRLDCNGIVDMAFNQPISGAGPSGSCAIPQTAGSTLLGGWFYTVGGEPRRMLARLLPTGPTASRLTFDGSTLTWTRSGPSPELLRTLFWVSTNGSNRVVLGAGRRNGPNWTLGNLQLSKSATVTADGYVQAESGAAWWIEEGMTVDPLTPPQIVMDDGWFGFKADRFGFNVRAVIGQKVVIDASADLAAWVPLQTNSMSTGGFYFSEQPPGRSRFYRARLQ